MIVKGVNDKSYIWSIVENITERKKAEAALENSHQQMANEKNKAEELARIDPLTGLMNRRALFEQAKLIDEQSKRYNRVYSIIMLDIDHFKQLNDTYGHYIGDDALKLVSSTIKSIVRSVDLAARFGGEEFLIILPETPIKNSAMIAERLRESIANICINNKSEEIKFTASMGISDCFESNISLEQAIQYADKAMYQAKNSGRNKIVEYIK